MTEAEEAAKLWQGRIVRPLRLRENEVYEAEIAGKRAALRLHRVGYQSPSAIRSELWWCEQLGSRGLPIATPIAMQGGDLLATLSTGRCASVVGWVEGEPFGEAGVPHPFTKDVQVARHRALGELLARTHVATDDLTLPPWFDRPSWDHDGLVGDAPLWGRFWEHPLAGEGQRARLCAARDWLSVRLLESKSPVGLIHADVLRENVFVHKGSLSLIDFDDSGFGYRWFDLGTVLSQDLYEPEFPALRNALIDGYRSMLPVNAEDVDSFTLARTLASVGWASSRLAMDHPVQRSHLDRALMMARRLVSNAGIG